MKRFVVGFSIVLCLGWLLIGVARSVTPFGGEFQVNTYTTGVQGDPAAAVGPNGEIVITWTNIPHPNSPPFGSNIQGQRYDSAGVPQGGEFQVNTYTTSYQRYSSVAIDGAGSFVVVWSGYGSSGTDNDLSSVQGQRYDSAGAMIAGEFQVNTYTTSSQRRPAVAADAGGNFTVVWMGFGSSGDDSSSASIQAQRYDSLGLPVSAEFQVNTYTTSYQRNAAVAVDGAGTFVVVWSSEGSSGSDASNRSIQGQRFDSTGALVGGEFQVNTYTTSLQDYPAVTAAAAGNFLVVWDSFGSAGSDTSGRSIQGQLFDSTGAAVGGQFQVNTYTTSSQTRASAGVDGSGNFVVAWRSRSFGVDTFYSIQAQVINADGTPEGSEFQVNTYTSSVQTLPAIAVADDGDFVIAWQSRGSAGTDTDTNSVQAQLYSGPLTELLELTVTGVFADEDMDGLGDPGETIDYTYEVSNPSTPIDPLTDVSVTDPDVAPIVCPSGNPIPTLGAGATEICTGSYVVTQADIDAGFKQTLTTADSNETGSVNFLESVQLGQGPGISLSKLGALDLGADGIAGFGDPINYLFDVTNEGNVTLSNVTVTDPLVAVSCPGGNPMPSLAPGVTETCTASYPLAQADLDAGVVNNTATVIGNPPNASSIFDQDSHSETIPRAAFACTGEAYIVQNENAELAQIDQSSSPFTFVPIGGPTGREINNLGFRSTDGLLYGVELNASGSNQLVQIDATGAIFDLGLPAGLPSNFRYDGGDVSTDGSTMYVIANNSAVYRVALPALTVTSVAKSGAAGNVFDWAYNPADGMLYGGDSSNGQLAQLNPTTGFRTDVFVTGLPSGAAYGGAWFNVAGNLFLYRNNGEIYEIDLAGPTVVDVQTGPGATRNDGAACIQSVIGAAKQMTATSDGLPETVTVDYVFENFSTTEDLFNLTSSDDLTAVFGVHGVDWTFTSISSVPASFANPSFNGHTDAELINQAPTQSLLTGATATVTVTLELLTFDAAAAFDVADLDFEVVTSGLSSPVAITHAGDSRIFVTEQAGRIVIIDGGTELATPFLDITARVSTSSERGLFSVAFHPDYASNGFFYVDYTDNSGDTVISRFSVTGDPNVADPASEAVLLNIPQPFANHNGGQLQFGPDGFLYASSGDGGSGNDPGCEGQDGATLLGAMLRLDVDQNVGTSPFHGIPASNPFVGDATVLDEIWALGMRNPWRFSFDRDTGDMYIGDVGQGAREEVDFQPAASAGGENYGWKVMEGTLCTGNSSGCAGISLPACNAPELTLPILEYSHSGGRCSITGGYVYRGNSIPGANGLYFYGDFCTGEVFAASDPGGGWQAEVLPNTFPSIATFGEDVDGELYLARAGTLYRMTGPAGPEFCNQVLVTGEDIFGSAFGDLSTDGLDPDPDGNDSPDERQQSCVTIVPPPPPDPEIRLVKNGALDDGGDGVADPGDVIDYTFEVTNTGNVTLTDITVSDPMIATVDCAGVTTPPQIASLAPAAMVTCTGSYTITQADVDAGQKDNTATASGQDPGANPISDMDSHSETLPQPNASLTLVKTGTFNDEGGDGFADVGETISYSLTVTNTGNVTLSSITVSDPMIATVDCSGTTTPPQIASLAPAASVICTGSYTITQADVDAGQKDNTATASGQDPGANPVSDVDSHSEPLPSPGGGPVPFACSGDAYIIQNQNAQLTRIDQSVSPFVFVPIGSATGIEINNLGFRSTDGFLYAVELTGGGNVQIIQIDATGAVTGLGRPAGLPTGPRFDAGDVSPDGTTMYITSNNQDLYALDLTSVPALPAVTSVNVSGATGFVFDWAVSPVDGRLYGGDSSQGQLASIDPTTGVRSDVALAGLPAGSGYGGAWFDAAGTLFLYQNSGTIYEIDLSGPTVVNTQTGPGATRNDGAACIDLAPPAAGISLVKSGSLDLGGNGTTDVGDVITYSFEITNTGTDALTNVTLSDPLIASFNCPSTHPIPSLAGGASETCTATYAITQADVDARVRDNTADVTGTHGSGPVSDQDSHSESIPAPPGAGPVPFACSGDAYIIQNQNAQLTRIDQSVSPFVFVSIGSATGIEINNLGFRSTDGLLYAVELTGGGNVQVIQIDATGAVFGLGRPSGLPTGPRFDAGDVSPDGSTMYITSNNQDLYALDLTSVPTLPAVTTVNVTGATGFVFDWAVSPVDGRLYGGDSSQGQLASIDPTTGVRTDVALAGLPAGSGYGGAWFDAAGTLFLYQNSGTIYEIDLSGPTVVNTQTGPGATRNDGAACIDLAPPAAGISLVKTGSLDLGGNGTTDVGDVITYSFEITNTGTDALTNVTLSDPLIASFNCPSYHPIPSLAGGASETCTATYAITQADVDARVRDNTADVTGTHGSGPVSDQDSHSESIPAPPGAGPVPFACSGDAYIIQNQNAQLTRIDQSVSPFVFVPIGSATGIEINNLGFRSTDGLLYAVELTGGGNVQVIQIDATGAVFGLGRPSGLPTGPRFDAGDVSPDGSTMYITSNNQDLYALDLTSVPTLPAVTTVNVTGATGFVFDWAVSPVDGRLYGGDSSQGQLASIDPTTGVRTDVALAGLPAGSGYGGAWFDAAGTLFLYQNSGTIYEIDLSGPTVVNTQTGPGATRNDGAACIDLAPPAAGISLVKTGSLDLGGNGTTDVGDVITYSFEITNTGTDALTNVTLSDPLIASFSCPSTHPIPSLAGGASETCTATYAITQADVDARVRDNTADVTGTHGSGPVSDQDSHSESIPAPPGAGPVPFACTGDAYLVQNQNAQLTRVDQSVSPFDLVSIGGPTGIEINNLGFRITDGLLYALELSSSGNVQVIQIDANGDVTGLGRPSGLPTGPRFDAGDVSPDGTTMYITATNQRLYRLDLTSVPTLPAVTSVAVTGANGFVFDWAVSPIDGMLYGGDSTSGQLASVDPTTGARTDVNVTGLPSGSAYGGAWFDNTGRLFLYRNSGAIYEIDLSGPTVVDVQTGPGATRNDGAACIPPVP